jgi:hypothetical protein
VVVAAGLANIAAICTGSGAWKVFSHESGITIIDSTGTLYVSIDDGSTWTPTNRLPRERTRYADEVCLESGICYRIRSDRLGVEAQDVPGGWETVWAYPSDRVEYLARQLPGPCGEGHGRLGLIGLVPGPPDSRWRLLVAAGADGLLGLDQAGSWVPGVYGEPAVADAGLEAVYLLPELFAAGLVAFALVMTFGFYDRTRATGLYLGAAIGWTAAAAVWGTLLAQGVRSAAVLSAASLVPLIGLAIWCSRRACDVSEVVVGGFFGGSAAVTVAAVRIAHSDVSWAMTLSVIAGIGFLASSAAVRADTGSRPLTAALWPAMAAVLGLGAAASLTAYLPWVGGLIGPKWVADLTALAIGAVFLGGAAWLWLRFGRVEQRRGEAR